MALSATLEPLGSAERPPRSAEANRQLNTEHSVEVPLSWFGQTLWKHAPLYLELIFLAACLRLLGLVEPFVFQVIIDRILPFQREASLIVVAGLFLMASLFQVGFEILAAMLGALTANRVTQELGARIFDHLFRLPFSHFRKWSIGETMSRVGETDTIRTFLVNTATGTVLDVVFVFVYLMVLLSLSVPLTLIVIVSLPLQTIVYFGFGPFLRKRLRAQFDAGARHQSQMVENITGVAAVKALNAERQMLIRLGTSLRHSLAASFRVGMTAVYSNKAVFAIQRCVTIAIILVGSRLVFEGQLTLGQLVAFHLLVDRVTSPIANFSKLWESWQNVKVSRQRLGDILGSQQEAFGQLPELPMDTEASIGFVDVAFSYNSVRPLISNFVFEAKPKSLTLIVGPSGAGKSTFGRLAAGLETPDSGLVKLGECDLSEYDPASVRSRIAYVPQEPYLFTGSILENLLMANPQATEEDVNGVLRMAALDRMVEQLPAGIHTEVGERGGALSGGQRQRVALARSLLKHPKVLVLDEPTSALDEITQREIAKRLEELKRDLTLIVISHRPGLFSKPDQVVDFARIDV